MSSMPSGFCMQEAQEEEHGVQQSSARAFASAVGKRVVHCSVG
jgi:hypothetical protein